MTFVSNSLEIPTTCEYKSNTACAIGTLTFMVLGSATYLQRIFMMGCKPDAVRWDRAA